MAVHKLILDDVFENELCTLIALHCTIEDYRLAYLLNKNLKISLKRKKSDLDFNKGISKYSLFEWEDDKQLVTWNLVSNRCKTETTLDADYQSLFDTEQKIVKTYHLIPENKKVNYFLKTNNVLSSIKEKNIIKNILEISQIATAYSVDASQLKSKSNLIFN